MGFFFWKARNFIQSWNTGIYLISHFTFITARKRNLGQGNIFTPVCQSFYSQWPPKRAARILLECIIVYDMFNSMYQLYTCSSCIYTERTRKRRHIQPGSWKKFCAFAQWNTCNQSFLFEGQKFLFHLIFFVKNLILMIHRVRGWRWVVLTRWLTVDFTYLCAYLRFTCNLRWHQSIYLARHRVTTRLTLFMSEINFKRRRDKSLEKCFL